ncbi:chemotaxis protein CheW [Hahella sp. SMD15-11]|uniref:Chemotaxis protein CheW n=1 Tax=Thermohahella caldifontis TaxID=3142973 RepID=A0AB39UVZ7_9GAMM
MNERLRNGQAGLLAPREALAVLQQQRNAWLSATGPDGAREADRSPEAEMLSGYLLPGLSLPLWVSRSFTRALLDEIRICQVPGAPGALEGFILHAGDIIPVWNLRTLAGEAGAESVLPTGRRRQYVLVLVCDGHLLGLLLDSVPATRNLPADALQPSGGDLPQPWMQGVASIQDQRIACLDVQALFETCGPSGTAHSVTRRHS